MEESKPCPVCLGGSVTSVVTYRAREVAAGRCWLCRGEGGVPAAIVVVDAPVRPTLPSKAELDALDVISESILKKFFPGLY